MNRQRKVVITTTYNEMGIIIDTKAEELGSSAQPKNVPSRKGVFIPDITVEMFRNASLEGIEDLLANGEMEDISLPSAQPEPFDDGYSGIYVKEEDVLKFYYVESEDDYWIGRRFDNFYYATWDRDLQNFVWSKSRYLPWGEHIVAPDTLWKEHTYPSEPKEIPLKDWLKGFYAKYFMSAGQSERKKGELPEEARKSAEEYCEECDHIEMCSWYPYEGCEFRSITQPERKKGKWIRITQGAMPEQYICPFCHRTIENYGVEELLSMRYPYCHCGADMRGDDDG